MRNVPGGIACMRCVSFPAFFASVRACCCLWLLLVCCSAVHAQFTLYNAGQAFTCIAIDSNSNVWAGTSKAGIYMLDKKSNAAITRFNLVSTGNLNTYNIQALAADKSGNVWAGHNGLANSGASGGGIDQINMNTYALVKHYATDANAECLNFVARDGLASSNSASLAVDKNGTVWSAQKNHDLTIAGIPPDFPGQYIITPGALSYKPAGNTSFFSKGTYRDYRAGADAPELPYPEYTCNVPINKSPQSRNCYAVAYGDGRILLSVAPYQAKNGSVFPARLLLYNTQGVYLGSYDTRSMRVPIIGVFSGIYITPKGRYWVTTSTGRLLYFNGSSWISTTLSTSLGINYNAITGDKFGNVYVGTTGGLAVCKLTANGTGITYVLYKNENGLSSTNVRGVAAETDGAIWLATDGGIVKFTRPAFSVYNLIHPIPKQEMDADKFELAAANDKIYQTNGDSIKINVAADSSHSTLMVYTGSGPKSLVFTIAGYKVDQDAYSSSVGKLELLVRNKDSLVYLYHHPSEVYLGDNKVYTTYSFGLRDSITNEYAIQGTLNMYHPPVLMVHGAWSSIKALETLRQYLLKSSSNYEDYQLLKTWFPNSNHSEPVGSVAYYRDKIPGSIDRLLDQCRENGLSAGKVDYIGHSRGGLFARYYLQNTFSDYPYRNDIHKLITVNTPHKGAQAANFVLDKRQLFVGVEIGKLFGPLFLSNPEREQGDDPNGAVELKVDADAITKDLNGSLLNKNIVPTHAVTTQYLFGNFSKADLFLQTIINGGSRIPEVGSLIVLLRLYALALGTYCLEGPVDNCLKEIFNGENSDVVVPLSSQRGGLEDKAVTLLNARLGHSKKTFLGSVIDVPAVMDDPETHARLAALLRENPDDTRAHFTKNGYQPGSPLQYNFLPNLSGLRASGNRVLAGSSVSIDPLLKGRTYRYGDSLPVAVTGSADIKNILISFSGLSLAEASSAVNAGNSLTVNYPVPKAASGRVVMVAYGFSDDGLRAIDSSFINIGLPAGIRLDSIKLQKDENLLQVPAGDSIALSVMGYFSDTIRNITYLPGISYALQANGIAATSAPNYLVGIRPGGFDQLKVSYQGKSDSGYIQVTDSVRRAPVNTPLPVNFSSFTGKYIRSQVELRWTTAQEQNNKEFEVQHSTNGATYNRIGTVPGKGNSQEPVSYFYPADRFSQGANYYRLKQVDLDGNSRLSAVVMVYVDSTKQASISLYPNPAVNRITLAIRQPSGSQLRLLLTDLAGKQVWSATYAGNTNAISVALPQLAKGLYVVTVVNAKGEKLLTEKLIVE